MRAGECWSWPGRNRRAGRERHADASRDGGGRAVGLHLFEDPRGCGEGGVVLGEGLDHEPQLANQGEHGHVVALGSASIRPHYGQDSKWTYETQPTTQAPIRLRSQTTRSFVILYEPSKPVISA